MEDSHIAEVDLGDGNGLFGVFDGHGGREVAKFVQNHFTKNLINCEAYKRKDFKLALENTFLKMDRLLLTEKGKQELRKYMEQDNDNGGYQDYLRQVESAAGCTATVALITQTEIYCANAGDSRTVMCERGHAVDLSKDHKPELPEERARIVKDGGEVQEGRVNGMLSLSRAIGDFDFKPITPPKDAQPTWFLNNHMVTVYPDVTVKPFHKDVEFLVLACDGVWDCKTSDQVIQYFRKIMPLNPNLKEIHNTTHNILDEICPNTFDEMRDNDGIGSDNMTVIIVDFLQNSGGAKGHMSLSQN